MEWFTPRRERSADRLDLSAHPPRNTWERSGDRRGGAALHKADGQVPGPVTRRGGLPAPSPRRPTIPPPPPPGAGAAQLSVPQAARRCPRPMCASVRARCDSDVVVAAATVAAADVRDVELRLLQAGGSATAAAAAAHFVGIDQRYAPSVAKKVGGAQETREMPPLVLFPGGAAELTVGQPHPGNARAWRTLRRRGIADAAHRSDAGRPGASSLKTRKWRAAGAARGRVGLKEARRRRRGQLGLRRAWRRQPGPNPAPWHADQITKLPGDTRTVSLPVFRGPDNVSLRHRVQNTISGGRLVAAVFPGYR